jgi:hypothetical protein
MAIKSLTVNKEISKIFISSTSLTLTIIDQRFFIKMVIVFAIKSIGANANQGSNQAAKTMYSWKHSKISNCFK